MSDENEPTKKDGAKPVDPKAGATEHGSDDDKHKAPTNGESHHAPASNGGRKVTQLGRKIRNYVN